MVYQIFAFEESKLNNEPLNFIRREWGITNICFVETVLKYVLNQKKKNSPQTIQNFNLV